MSIYTEINKAWATLFGFKVENDEATFNDKPLYWNNNAVGNWDDLLSAKPSDLKQNAGFAETPNTKTYEELMTAENFSYSAFNWTNEHGKHIGFSLGSNTLQFNQTDRREQNITFYAMSNGVEIISNSMPNTNDGLGFTDELLNPYIGIYYYIDKQTSYEELAVDDAAGTNAYTCFYFVDNADGYFISAFVVYYSNNDWLFDKWTLDQSQNWVKSTQNIWTSVIETTQNTKLCFDDGSHLPEDIEWNTELASYFVPELKEETTTILTQTTATQAMLGAQIMTHVSLWGMGIGCACFIAALVKFMGRCFSRR